MRLGGTVSLLFVLSCLLPATTSAFGEVAVKERKGLVTFEVSLKAPADAKDVRLWIPYPVSDPDQTISDVTISGNYTKKSVSRKTRQGTAALFAEWKGPQKERRLTYSFKAAR